MKAIFTASALVVFALMGTTASEPALAKGCIKGAIVGGVVGHMAGHGKTGAVAGCVIGHHQAAEKDKEQREQQQAPSH